MKLGFRIHNLNKRIAARTALKRMFQHRLGFKAPILLLYLLLNLSSCTSNENDAKEPVYVKPSIDYKGRYRKGHVRMPVNTRKDAVKSRIRSKYYYETRGKYRQKRKKQ